MGTLPHMRDFWERRMDYHLEQDLEIRLAATATMLASEAVATELAPGVNCGEDYSRPPAGRARTEPRRATTARCAQ